MTELIAFITETYSKIWNFIADVLAKAGVELDTSNIPDWVKPQ